MSNLLLLTKKNIILLFRAKSSALIVFFAPLLLILILGLSFNNTSKYGLNIGVHASSYNDEINNFLAELKQQEFNVVKYDATIAACVEDIKLGIMHTCIELPETFQIQSNTPAQVTFYVDKSKINLVWMIQDTMQNKLGIKEQQISENIAKDVLSKLTDTTIKINNEKGSIASAKDKSSSASKNAEDTKNILSALDLTAPVAAYDTTILTSFKDSMIAYLDDSVLKIAAAKASVSKTSLNSSEQKKITDSLDAATLSLANAQVLINSEEATSLNAIVAMVNSLQTDLTSTKTKLNIASAKITNSNTNLNSVKTTLTETMTLLDNTQKTLEQININLQSQKVTDANVISKPIQTKIEPIAQEKTHLSYMLPILLILVIMFSSLLLGTSLVMMEKNSPAFIRNFFLPIRKINFILSIYLTNVFLILIQVIIILILSIIFVKEITNSLHLLAIILFLAASIFTFLGMLIGYLFTSEETGILASLSLGSLLLFISGTILPIEAASGTIREIISFSPFVIAERLIREIFIFNSPFTSLWMDFLILIGYSVMHKHLLERFLRHHHNIHKQNSKLTKNG